MQAHRFGVASARLNTESFPVQIFGTDIYTASSQVCKAAVHAGVIGNNGGCASIRMMGSQWRFVGSTRNGVTSRDFPYWAATSFSLDTVDSQFCTDLGWGMLVVGLVLLLLFRFAISLLRLGDFLPI